MNGPRDSSDQSQRIDLAAAEWLVKRDRGFTPAEQDAFFQWLAVDPRHGEWMRRHGGTWRDLDALAQWRPEHSTEPNPDLLARPRPRVRWALRAGFAVAACIALGVVAWRGGLRSDVAPASAKNIAHGYERRVLEDGSVVELNRGGAIEVAFTAGERRVALTHGEAHFTVTKNSARPFIVRASGVDVRAVGTAFNVRLGAESVEVLVTEGRVQVNSPQLAEAAAEPAELRAGQRTVVPLHAGAPPPVVVAVAPEEISRMLAWQPTLLDFPSTPLAEVVTEFNRRNAVQISIADPVLASLPIVASFRSDNLDGFVRLLELTAGVRVERRSEQEIVLHAKR